MVASTRAHFPVERSDAAGRSDATASDRRVYDPRSASCLKEAFLASSNRRM
jgi:hypothetical protein